MSPGTRLLQVSVPWPHPKGVRMAMYEMPVKCAMHVYAFLEAVRSGGLIPMLSLPSKLKPLESREWSLRSVSFTACNLRLSCLWLEAESVYLNYEAILIHSLLSSSLQSSLEPVDTLPASAMFRNQTEAYKSKLRSGTRCAILATKLQVYRICNDQSCSF